MGFDLDDKHLVEIDHVSIIEPIDEVFDGITSLLSDNAVMYGSSVTAILAGLPIVGDLDIAVSSSEHSRLTQKIADSVKWLQVEGRTVPESDGSRRSFGMSPSKARSNPYKEAKHLPISDIIAFKTVNDARIQIMMARKQSGDPLEDALDVVRKVDFAFCGMALDKWGRLLETIPHGYVDCLNRDIRIVDYQPRLDTVRLVHRIRKYTKRGWHLTFSIDQAIQNINKAKRAALKAPKKKKKYTPRAPGLFRIRKDQRYGVVLELKNSVINAVGSRDKCRDVVRHFGNENGMNLNANRTPFGTNFYSPNNGELTMPKARRIVENCVRYFKSNYGVTPEMLRRESKKTSMSKMYDGNVKYSSGGYVSGSVGYATYKTSSGSS